MKVEKIFLRFAWTECYYTPLYTTRKQFPCHYKIASYRPAHYEHPPSTFLDPPLTHGLLHEATLLIMLTCTRHILCMHIPNTWRDRSCLGRPGGSCFASQYTDMFEWFLTLSCNLLCIFRWSPVCENLLLLHFASSLKR